MLFVGREVSISTMWLFNSLSCLECIDHNKWESSHPSDLDINAVRSGNWVQKNERDFPPLFVEAYAWKEDEKGSEDIGWQNQGLQRF